VVDYDDDQLDPNAYSWHAEEDSDLEKDVSSESDCSEDSFDLTPE
jgi:hypothetical protein